MADGTVVVDLNMIINAETGSRVDLFAVESSSYPGGYYYRFQYYTPDESDAILRYDNAADAHGVGPHHRHGSDTVTRIIFHGLIRSVVTVYRWSPPPLAATTGKRLQPTL